MLLSLPIWYCNFTISDIIDHCPLFQQGLFFIWMLPFYLFCNLPLPAGIIAQHPEITFDSVFVLAFAKLKGTVEMIVVLVDQRLRHISNIQILFHG